MRTGREERRENKTRGGRMIVTEERRQDEYLKNNDSELSEVCGNEKRGNDE